MRAHLPVHQAELEQHGEEGDDAECAESDLVPHPRREHGAPRAVVVGDGRERVAVVTELAGGGEAEQVQGPADNQVREDLGGNTV